MSFFKSVKKVYAPLNDGAYACKITSFSDVVGQDGKDGYSTINLELSNGRPVTVNMFSENSFKIIIGQLAAQLNMDAASPEDVCTTAAMSEGLTVYVSHVTVNEKRHTNYSFLPPLASEKPPVVVASAPAAGTIDPKLGF